MSFQHNIIAATQAFNANVHKLANQRVSKLRDTVMEESMSTKSEFFDRSGDIEMQLRTSRHQQTAFTPIPFSRRRVEAFDYEVGEIIDHEDLMRSLVNPQSETIDKFVTAANRNADSTIITSLLGNAAAIDADFGVTNVALPTEQIIPDAGSNLTVNKIKDGIENLLLNDVDLGEDRPYMAITGSQYRSLLNDIEFVNKDYKLSPGELTDPDRVNAILGVDIRIVKSDLLPKVGNVRKTVLYTKQACKFGVLNYFTSKVGEDFTIGASIRIIGKQNVGAVRMEESRVVEIDCDES